MSPSPLLRVTGLTTVFDVERQGVRRTVRAVDNVSFTIEPGGSLGLVGESGCGKTVTALSVVGLVPPPGRVTAGTIEFDGRNLAGLSEDDLRRIRGAGIGFVFQEPTAALNPVFTIGDQIAEAIIVHGKVTRAEAQRRAVALLDAVRMPDTSRRAREYPHQLSGGQRQRAVIATAVANQPALLIADEPTTAMDVTVQAEILDLLTEMRRTSGLALLLITHDLGVVSRLTDSVAVMYAGRIVEEGPTADVLASPAHPYTRGLIASLPGSTPGERLRTIPGSVPDLDALPACCAFAPRCGDCLEICTSTAPPHATLAPGRAVRCHLCEGGA